MFKRIYNGNNRAVSRDLKRRNLKRATTHDRDHAYSRRDLASATQSQDEEDEDEETNAATKEDQLAGLFAGGTTDMNSGMQQMMLMMR